MPPRDSMVLLAAAIAFAGAGCDVLSPLLLDDPEPEPPAGADGGADCVSSDVLSCEAAPIEIVGKWSQEGFEPPTLITETTWQETAWPAEIVSWDNDFNFAWVKAPEDHPLAPGLFTRHHWTEPEGGTWWKCSQSTAFLDLESARAGSDAANVHPDDLVTGCNGTSWKRMTRFGACTNDADLAIHYANVDKILADMQTCIGDCLASFGDEDEYVTCYGQCMVARDGFSDACGVCYGQYSNCVGLHCLEVCSGDDIDACTACAFPVCTPAFAECSGLDQFFQQAFERPEGLPDPEPEPEATPVPAPDVAPEPSPDVSPEPSPDVSPEPAPEPAACTISCDGKVCGDDGCGSTCGTCVGGAVCSAKGECLDWAVPIAGGPFVMGCNPAQDAECYEGESPPHVVHVPAFAIGRQEVTNAEVESCSAAGGCQPPHYQDGACYRWFFGAWGPGTIEPEFAADAAPAVCVTWLEAKTYCTWAGGRLCTEAEWERAARGACPGKAEDRSCSPAAMRKYPWGDLDPADEKAANGLSPLNLADETAEAKYPEWETLASYLDGYADTAPAGAFAPGKTPEGVLQLAGNVQEWVEDCSHAGYLGAPGDGSAWTTDCKDGEGVRVLRGGSFFDLPRNVRASNRYADFVPTTNSGIRCCADVSP